MTRLLDDYILPAVRSDLPLQENPTALAGLAARAAQASNPDQPAAALPPIAALVSGRTYILAENPFGWRSLALRFDPGSRVAIVTVDEKLGLMIGLDNRYRATGVPGAGTIALRGRWEAGPAQAPGTFTVEAVTLGEFPHQAMRFSFSGPDLTLSVMDKVLDTKTELRGSAAAITP
jgi:hypothetical protein